MFQMILGEYPFDKVKMAFLEYVKYNTEIPTPADIVKILDPRKHVDFSPVLYREILERCKKDNFLMPEEKAYLNAFEKYHFDQVKDFDGDL